MARMRRFALLAMMAAGGCAGSVAQVRLAVELTGAGASPAEQQRCVEAVRRRGGIIDAQASMHALVTVEPNANRVQVLSARRGLVHDKLEPQASVEQLCQEALAAASSAIRREPLPSTIDERSPGVARVPPSPTSSGPASGAPITDH